jgi:hypothetical protein
MTNLHEFAVCTTVLAVLAVPAALSAQVTVYHTRTAFDTAYPGLPVEDFEDFTDALTACDAPANNGTSCPGGYDMGDILPGLEIDCALHSGPGGGGLAIIPTGFDFNPSIEFASNWSNDYTIINLSPAVEAIGFHTACHFGSPQMEIEVYDGDGALISVEVHVTCDPTGFFIGWSNTAPEGIGRIELNDPSGASFESLDDIAFGDPAPVLNAYGTRVDFDAANPGLPVEDFEDFTDALTACDAPANNGTSCPGGYDMGDILPGLEIDCAVHSGPGGIGLAILSTGFNYNPSIEFGSNWHGDNTIINLDPPVHAIGFHTACHFGSPPRMDIVVYDGNGVIIWGGNHVPCDPTGFFIGWDYTAPEGIGRIELNDPSGTSIESLDDIAFPSSGGGLPFEDGFESGDTSAWSATVP